MLHIFTDLRSHTGGAMTLSKGGGSDLSQATTETQKVQQRLRLSVLMTFYLSCYGQATLWKHKGIPSLMLF